MANQKEAIEIKQEYETEWLAIREVAAVGVGNIGDKLGIIVSVTENPDKVREKIPGQVGGVPVKIQQTGAFSAL